jgi:hypothetical protein
MVFNTSKTSKTYFFFPFVPFGKKRMNGIIAYIWLPVFGVFGVFGESYDE